MPPKDTLGALAPPLKWAGGKRWLVPHLLNLWTPYRDRRLVEPFCGGLAVTLGLNPGQALLNDLNPHLINFYKHLWQGLRITIPMANDADLYYRHRARFNALVRQGRANSSESAQLFYYLNRTGYNGLCRFNRRDEFNVPFGKYKTINYVTEFTKYSTVLEPWHFQSGNFEAVALRVDDFVYADPPYDVEFVSYSKEGFAWKDQVRLAEWLVNHPGPVVLSNQATDRIVKLYESLGFRLMFFMSPRRISCTGDRSPAREVLALRGLEIDRETMMQSPPDQIQLTLLT